MLLSIKSVQAKAIRLGLVSAVIGCGVFVFIEQSIIFIKFGFDDIADLGFAFLIFVIGSMLVAIPTVISSSLLGVLIYHEIMKHGVSHSRIIFLGIAFGAVAGIGTSVLGIILTSGRGSASLYLLRSIETTIIAVLCGGWTSNQLTKYILANSNSVSLP